LTPPGSLLDFEISLRNASVFFGGKFFDNSAVDLFRFRPARDRVTGTGRMVDRLLRESDGSLVGN